MAKPEGHQIIIDQKPVHWPEDTITGSKILELTGADQGAFSAWKEIPGEDDQEIRPDEAIDLTEPGVERFFTAKKVTKEGQS